MRTGTFTTYSPDETYDLAYSLAEEIASPTVLLLTGDLGAGKTVFAKGIAAGLGIDPADVASPTFTLVNSYDGRLKFYHVDLYRLEGGAAIAYALGLDEILSEEAVVLIEWAERLGEFEVGPAYRIRIKFVDQSTRLLEIEVSNGRQIAADKNGTNDLVATADGERSGMKTQ